MAFHNVSLPTGLQYGSQFGAGFSTIVQQTASGHEVRVARQSAGRHRFFPLKQLQTSAEAMALKTFALARRGSLHSFRIKDELDNTTAADGTSAPTSLDQGLGTGDGTTTTFQLVKVYDSSGPAPYTRTITLPVSGSIVVAVAGTPTTSFTESNGVITLNAAPTLGQVVTAGCRFEVPVRFAKGIDEWARLQADAFSVWSMPDLECIEVLYEVEWPELWYPGGDYDHGSKSSNILIDAKLGKLHLVQATANISAVLPAPDLFPGGDHIFTIHNKAASSHTVQVRDDAGNAVGSAISAGTTKRIFLSISSGTAVWGIY